MEEPEEKRIRIELPLEVDVYEESYEQRYEQKSEQSYEDPLDSNVCLTYDILRIVFRYLNGKDLSSVAMVCRSWLEAANNEKCLRGPCCFVEHYKPVDIYPSQEKKLANESLGNIKESTIKPSIGFFFLSSETPHDIKSRICELLPKNCEAIMLFTHSIILNNDEMEHPYPNIVCALLPQIPNVKISIVKVTDRALGRDKYTEYMQMIQEASRQEDGSACLMLFCNRYGHSMGSYMASLARLSNDERIISLWGGVVEEMQYVHINNERFIEEESDKPYCVALLLTGSMQSWSIVVDRKCKTKEQVEEKLKLFKQQVKLQKHSVGFMFACIARGKYMYHEENVESTIFKRLFPEVPLVGCFGNGEFGKDTIVYNDPQLSLIQYRKKNLKNFSKNVYPLYQKNYSTRRHKFSWHNEFSTMFMILTYG